MTLGNDILTVEQASERSGYSIQYIRRLIRQGKVDAEKVGSVYLVNARSLDTYRASMVADERLITGPRSESKT